MLNIPACWGGVHPYRSDVEISMDDLDLVTTFCTCGTPDPLEHIKSCFMVSIPLEILREVQALCA